MIINCYSYCIKVDSNCACVIAVVEPQIQEEYSVDAHLTFTKSPHHPRWELYRLVVQLSPVLQRFPIFPSSHRSLVVVFHVEVNSPPRRIHLELLPRSPVALLSPLLYPQLNKQLSPLPFLLGGRFLLMLRSSRGWDVSLFEHRTLVIYSIWFVLPTALN